MRRKYVGFTMVELLAALALASLLLAALFLVAARIRAQPVAALTEPWARRQRVTDLLWRDLAQAGSVRQEDDGLRLTTWHALPMSGEATTTRHLPVAVLYQVDLEARMLLRHQQHLTGRAEPWTTEVLGWDIANLALLERDDHGAWIDWTQGDHIAHIGFGQGRVLQVTFDASSAQEGGRP